MKERKPLNVEIGNRIRIARENNHLTQEKMAEILDLSVQFVSDMERGVVGASTSTIINVCRSLHVSSDYILMGVEDSGISDIVIELKTLDERQLEMARRAFIIFTELAHYNANTKKTPPKSQ